MRRILLTGASGYVGGRLLRVLEARGLAVRCLARNPAYLSARVAPETEVVAGDVLDESSLDRALQGIDTAYYLVHALGDASGFEAREAAGARAFGAAAFRAGVRRIIYLGGLGDEREDLSPHLRSRHEVGRILRGCGVPTLELRASIVIGSGSLSFEMIRALSEHLPVMITPRWVSVLAQPIGIQDLLAHMVEALDVPVGHSLVIEIGGQDRLSYGALMREYARQRGLRRWMIPVPVLTPRLSSLWLGLVTPLYARVGRKLIESIQHPTVVTTDTAARLFSITPRSASAAIRAALENEDLECAETRWYDAVSAAGLQSGYGGERVGSRIIDRRHVDVAVSPADAFRAVEQIGGQNGWYAFDGLWRLRGFVDLLVGGVGMRRGRPVHRELQVGDAVDFWRVEAIEPGGRLRLHAEMKLPGRAWLEFSVQPTNRGARITQTATFDAWGLAGRAYWYGIYPLHALVFRGMIAAVAGRAVASASATQRMAHSAAGA